MFGFACRETRQLMPLPIMLAHGLTRRLAYVRRKGIVPYLRPTGSPRSRSSTRTTNRVRVDTVVVSSQHAEDVTPRRDPARHHRARDRAGDSARGCAGGPPIHINPTGSFVKGGPMADTGLTGRKIIVDTYGGVGSHGGGALLGQGSQQGGSLGQLRRALRGQEPGGLRACATARRCSSLTRSA